MRETAGVPAIMLRTGGTGWTLHRTTRRRHRILAERDVSRGLAVPVTFPLA
jgi:hypothetical protein